MQNFPKLSNAEVLNRLQSLNRPLQKSQQPKRIFDIFKPQEGAEYEIRLLAYPFNDQQPWIEPGFHFRIGKMPVLCPLANYGKECAICDFATQLYSYNNADGSKKGPEEKNADYAIYRTICLTRRAYLVMVERGKEVDGPKFLAMGPKQLGSDILSYCSDKENKEELGLDTSDDSFDYNVLFNEKNGFDLKLKTVPSTGGEFSFMKMKFDIKKRPSALFDKKNSSDPAKDTKDMLSRIKKFSEIYPEVSSEQTAEILKAFQEAGMKQMPAAEAKGGTEKYPVNSTENAAKSGKQQIDEAFGDMLNEQD